eukprot:scaffold374_cov282-Alexandrium_tamarense.AAC.10
MSRVKDSDERYGMLYPQMSSSLLLDLNLSTVLPTAILTITQHNPLTTQPIPPFLLRTLDPPPLPNLFLLPLSLRLRLDRSLLGNLLLLKTHATHVGCEDGDAGGRGGGFVGLGGAVAVQQWI